jgi:hypothetical protein
MRALCILKIGMPMPGMNSFLIAIGLAFFSIPFSLGQEEKGQPKTFITGRVTSEKGEPLAAVKVEWEGGPINKTDANGTYYLHNQFNTPIDYKFCCRIRFSLPGYKTLTKAIDTDARKLDVVLESGENKWIPLICKSSPEEKNRIGWKMKILIPKRTPVQTFTDADSFCQKIYFHSGPNLSTMSICSGPLWGGMWPSKNQIISASKLDERHWSNRSVFDYRGLDDNGRRWRYTGWFNETIDYKNASVRAADFFDSIIDNLCWDASAFPKDK